jgi:hypothetical protein
MCDNSSDTKRCEKLIWSGVIKHIQKIRGIDKMKTKLVATLLMIVVLNLSIEANAAVCYVDGNVTSVIPSAGDVGVKLDVDLSTTACSCNYNMIWIDINTDGGKAMYSAALSAKMATKQVLATIEDGKGQGAAGNDSITYRYWASCQLMALEMK